jgi:hypothetical protein
MSKVNVNTIEPSTGTDITLGASGDTITVPSGATFTQSGTMNASAITAGTIDTARLGSGTASSTTILYGDQTYKTEPSSEANTPAFIAKYSGDGSGFANATYVKLSFDSEVYDSGSVYDTSNYRFTPGVAGNYQLYARIIFQAGSTSPSQARIAIYKNGSVLQYSRWTTATTISDWTVQTSHIDIANTTDYYEAYAYQSNATSSTTFTIGDSGNTNLFYGYRIIT